MFTLIFAVRNWPKTPAIYKIPVEMGHRYSIVGAKASNPSMQASSFLLFIAAVPLFGQTQFPAELVKAGQSEFTQACAFCHGRDAGGGEEGPDLTRSKLVTDDVAGNLLTPVIRNGRPQNGMPAFNLAAKEMESLVAFIHTQKTIAESQKGGRRGVEVSDLQTGNVEAGQKYFTGTGKCNTCHNPAGDLASVAKRYEGLKLIERLLYPKGAKATLTVTLPSGETVTGTLAYKDEFNLALTDKSGRYRAWPADSVKAKIDDPAQAHANLLAVYSDDDIHNLMAYLQTLR
jgi:cytochrome c oxidase cbb3-type subunit 3